MTPTTWLVYKHTNKVSGKAYIGVTKNTMEQRWNEHVYASKLNTQNNYLQNAIQKYALTDWMHEVLEDGIESWEYAQKREIYYIAYYDTYTTGYNTTTGGEGANGYVYTDEERKAMSVERRSRNGNKVYTFYNPELNKKETLHPMDLAKKYDILPGNIWYVVNNKSKQAQGWFLFDPEVEVYSGFPVHEIEHAVHGLSKGTISDLADKHGLTKRNLRRVVSGERNHHKGWTLPGNTDSVQRIIKEK